MMDQFDIFNIPTSIFTNKSVLDYKVKNIGCLKKIIENTKIEREDFF